MHPDPHIAKVCLVPGLPHILLAADKNPGWARLKVAYDNLREELAVEAADADLMLIYSTQWLSVIGHLFQTDPNPTWTLVDQNWYEYGSIPYELKVDAAFGQRYADTAREFGLASNTVNYHGFPIDTGTVVAAKLLNPDNRFPMSMVSCNMYAERDETLRVALAGRAALERSGKRAIIVLVSSLSNRYHTTKIDPAEDRIHSLKDDEWNRKILEMLEEGRLEDTSQVARQVASQANGDMGFKGIWWLAGITGQHNRFTGEVLGYEPVWGTGAAVVSLTPALKETLEKEVDEAPIALPTAAPSVSASSSSYASASASASGPPLRSESARTGEGLGVRERESAKPGEGLGERKEESAGPGSNGHAHISASAPEPVGPYPHARRVGNLVFVSGIGPRRRGSSEIPGVMLNKKGKIVEHDIRLQTRSCIENIQGILAEQGLTLAHVVDVSAFLTNLEDDFEGFNEVYAEYFGSNGPTRTTVEVERLPTPINVELKVIAVAE